MFNETDRSEAAAPDARAGVPLEPSRLLAALWSARRVLTAAMLLCGLGGAGIAKTVVKPEYEAEVVFQWEHRNAKGVDENRGFQTVLDSVKLRGNLEKVRARLGLSMTLEALGARIKLDSSGDSDVIALRATADDGEAAARLAEAVTTAFIEHRVDLERRHLAEQAESLSASEGAARLALADARDAYHEFLVQNGIADITVEVRTASEQAARLHSGADVARAEADAELARVESLRRVTRTEQRTTVLHETQVMPDARKLAETRADLDALKGQLSEEHPRVRSLEAQIDSMGRRAATTPRPGPSERTIGRNPQWDTAQQSLTQALAQREGALRRQLAYEELLAKAQANAARLSRLEGEASKRLAVVHAAEKHLADLEDQLAKIEDASRSASSGIRVLAPAKAAPYPSKSRRMLVVLVAPVLGLVLASLFVVIRAVGKLYVQTSREVAFWGRAPVVAASTWPADRAAIHDLSADLAVGYRGAVGSTLLLGFGDREDRYVDPLALQLAEKVGALAGEGDADRAGARLETTSSFLTGAALRRAARRASRVLLLVESGQRTALDLASVRDRLGRDEGIGFVLIGLGTSLTAQPDRVGEVDGFWRAGGAPRPQRAVEKSER